MRPLLLLAWIAPLAIPAQSLITASNLAAVRAAFDQPSPYTFKCEFFPTEPAMNYRLRFEAGFRVTVPLSQLESARRGSLLLRVTPEGRQPVYLAQPLAAVSVAPGAGEYRGAFLIGEGAYQVDAELVDDEDRVCSSTWRVQASPSGAERKLDPMAPGEVAESSLLPVSDQLDRGPRLKRLTILLHAAPFHRQSAQFEDSDLAALSGSAASLIEQLRPAVTRLAAFSLDQSAVLFQNDDFKIADVGRAITALQNARLGVIDFKAQQRDGGPVNMAAELFRREFGAPQPPDAVVLLGPYFPLAAGSGNTVPKSIDPGATRFFYLQYREAPSAMRIRSSPGATPLISTVGRRIDARDPIRYPQLSPASLPDPLAVLAKSAKGEVIDIYRGHDLASAIQKIAARMAEK